MKNHKEAVASVLIAELTEYAPAGIYRRALILFEEGREAPAVCVTIAYSECLQKTARLSPRKLQSKFMGLVRCTTGEA